MSLTMLLCGRKTSSANLKKVLQLVVVCFGLSFCLPAHSQSLGRISGSVTDASGGAIAGATVTVTDVARGVTRTLTTDSVGAYSAPNLIAGTYAVHAADSGFQAFDRQGVQIGVGADVHVDIQLQTGAQTQTITVTGEVPAITTTNAQLAATITGEALNDLPFSGHNYVQLVGLLPAFQLKPGSGAGRTQDNSNGLPGEFNVFVVDGVADQMSYFSTSAINGGYSAGGPEQAVMLPTDAIQEFNVVQNGKAEFGWRPGAQLNVAVKSGANSIHGTAFALGRDTALMARNAFFSTKTPTAFENYGGSFGGPVKKDKFFYFFGYEGQRYNVGNPKNSNVPTTASGLGASGSLPDAITDLIVNHSVTPSPLSLALAGCVTTPAVQCTANKGLFANNTQSNTFPIDFPTFGGTDNGVGRGDYHPNENNTISGWFFDGDGIAVAPVSSVTQPYWSSPLEVHSKVVRAWWDWIPNSAWVNDLRFGWDYTLSSNAPSYDCTAASGAPNYASLGFVSGGTACGFPAITITGFSGNVLAGAGGLIEHGAMSRWLDNASYTRGNHSFKFGGEFLRAGLAISNGTDGGKGTLAFNTNNGSPMAFPGASALENFLAGDVSSGTIQTGTIPRNFTDYAFALFAQDDWRIFPRLTVNLGLRYEYTLPIHEVNNLIGNVDLATQSGVCQAGTSGCTLYKMHPWDFAPRFGLAWDVTGKGKTVVRAGFNIIYEQPWIEHFISTQTTLQSVPTGLTFQNGGTMVTTPGGTINLAKFSINPPASPIPWAVNTPIFANYVSASGSCTNSKPCSIGGVTPYLEYPMVLNWNFGVQHAITNTLTIDVNYVGNHGQHLNGFTDINRPTPGASGSANEQARRPYTANGEFPWFATMQVYGVNYLRSNYNALQVVGTERASHGLTFLAAFTFAHALASGNPTEINNPNSQYGNAASDIRDRFSFGPSYFIPGRQGFGQMLEGWQVASTLSIYSGRAMDPTDATDDLSGTGQTGALADHWTLVGNPHDFDGFGGSSTIPCFVASGATGAFAAKANGVNICTVGLPAACTSAAAAEATGEAGTTTGTQALTKLGCYMVGNSVMVPAAQGTFGTMSLYEIHSKGFSEWDMSIIKSWKIRERLTTQFRAELYNVLNMTQYATPTATLSTPSTFGQSQATPDVSASSTIVGTGGPRKIQLGLKFLF